MLVTASWQINADTRVNMLHEKLAVVVFRVFLVSFAFFICKCIVYMVIPSFVIFKMNYDNHIFFLHTLDI